jgi:hypothetical protein
MLYCNYNSKDMLETELIKLGLFSAIVGFVTFSVLVILKIDKEIEKRRGNKYKNCLYWS